MGERYFSLRALQDSLGLLLDPKPSPYSTLRESVLGSLVATGDLPRSGK